MNKREVNLRWKNSRGNCCNKAHKLGKEKFPCHYKTCPYYLDCVVVDKKGDEVVVKE